MRGSWWRWLSALLATLCGLAFGWVAGMGLVNAAAHADHPSGTVIGDVMGRPLPPVGCDAQPRWEDSHSSSRFQPSSASSWR